jgi:hypothetical protein
MAELDAIIRDHGVPRGWPAPLAQAYLTRHLTFNVGRASSTRSDSSTACRRRRHHPRRATRRA